MVVEQLSSTAAPKEAFPATRHPNLDHRMDAMRQQMLKNLLPDNVTSTLQRRALFVYLSGYPPSVLRRLVLTSSKTISMLNSPS